MMMGVSYWTACLCVASLLLLQSHAFTSNPHQHSGMRLHQHPPSSTSKRLPRRTHESPIALYAASNNQTEITKASNNVARNDDNIFDTSLLVPDLLAVAVGCELLGLMDAVTDPLFLFNGGWLQAVTSVPTTLPLLISRFSVSSVLWILASLSVQTFLQENSDNDNAIMASGQSAIQYSLRIGAVFLILRVLVALALAIVGGTGGWDVAQAVEVIRACYVVVLSTTAARYFVQALYYR